MYPPEQLVRIKKLAHRAESPVLPGDWEDYLPGRDDNGDVSLPIEYEIEAYIQEMELGFPMRATRISRNGVKMLGIFTTSPLVVIAPGLVTTHNSIYTIEPVEPG